MKKRILIVVISLLVLAVAGLATGVALAASESHDVGISLRVVGEPLPTPTPTPSPTGDVFTVSPSFLALGDVEPGDVITKYITVTKTGASAAYTVHTSVSLVPWGSVNVSPSAFLLAGTYQVTITISISESATPGEYNAGSVVNFYVN